METTRQHKIARLIQKDMGEIFQAMGRDVFPGNMITVTKVHISPDLFLAKIYLSLFGKTEKQELLALIKEHRNEVRLKLVTAYATRCVPSRNLTFSSMTRLIISKTLIIC